MKLYCTQFNFCQGHGRLKYKDERNIRCKKTPAREAGVTQSKWTLKELLTFRWFKTPVTWHLMTDKTQPYFLRTTRVTSMLQVIITGYGRLAGSNPRSNTLTHTSRWLGGRTELWRLYEVGLSTCSFKKFAIPTSFALQWCKSDIWIVLPPILKT